MRVSKNIADIERMLSRIREENRRTGTTPPWKIEARNGGFLSGYLRTYRQEHRAELNEYQRQYREAHPERTLEQWRKDTATYRQTHKEQIADYQREYRRRKHDGKS